MKRNKIARIILATLLTATMFTACHKAETTTSSADSSSVESSTSSEESSSTQSDTSSIESSSSESTTSSDSDTSSTATSSTVVSSTTPSQAPVSSATPTPTPTSSVAPIKPVVTYTTTVVAPTCTTDGYTINKGSDGTSYNSNVIKATGHKMGEWKVTKQPTTESEGEESRSCQICGYTETRAIAKLQPVATPNADGTTTNKTYTNYSASDRTCIEDDSPFAVRRVVEEYENGRNGEKYKSISISTLPEVNISYDILDYRAESSDVTYKIKNNGVEVTFTSNTGTKTSIMLIVKSGYQYQIIRIQADGSYKISDGTGVQ